MTSEMALHCGQGLRLVYCRGEISMRRNLCIFLFKKKLLSFHLLQEECFTAVEKLFAGGADRDKKTFPHNRNFVAIPAQMAHGHRLK